MCTYKQQRFVVNASLVPSQFRRLGNSTETLLKSQLCLSLYLYVHTWHTSPENCLGNNGIVFSVHRQATSVVLSSENARRKVTEVMYVT
jgi:hypothetical protein